MSRRAGASGRTSGLARSFALRPDAVEQAVLHLMNAYTRDDLLARGEATLVASWTAYAEGAGRGAAVNHHVGVTAAVFPSGAERDVYNNALLARGLTPAEVPSAVDAMEDIYALAGVDRFAAWVHDSDSATREHLERRGYTVDTSTLAMGARLALIALRRPALTLGSLPWTDYVRTFDLPDQLLEYPDREALRVLVAFDGPDAVTTALSYDHDGDCGIYNVGTVEHARRHGFASAMTALQLCLARDRGCTTASLQSTTMAERVYAAAGFEPLGRYIEFVRR